MSSKIVILGSTGFIGSALMTQLQQYDDLLVKGYHSSNLNLASRDCVDKLCEIVDDKAILIITARSHQAEDQFEAFSNDISIVTNIAQCLYRKPVKKCLYFSTLSVYGEHVSNLAITEDTPVAPSNPYGTAKFVGECMMKQAAKKNNTPLIIFRPCMIYGPGDSSFAYGPDLFIKSFLEDGEIRIFGDGSEQRDYIYIRDLVDITLQFAFDDQFGTYNLGTGRSYSFQEIIDNLRKIIQQDFNVIHIDRDRPKTDLKINPLKFLTVMPDFCFTKFKQGLEETYRYFLSNLS